MTNKGITRAKVCALFLRESRGNGNTEMIKMEMGMAAFFMCAKILIGRLSLVNFGARYGQFDVTGELPDRTHWPVMFHI